jgi:integrase
LVDEQGARKPKWISTGLPIKGNKKKAEEMLIAARKAHTNAVVASIESDTLFADYIENTWLPSKQRIETSTLAEYTHEVKVIADYYRKQKITLAGMSVRNIEDFYDVLRTTLSECSVQKYHTKIHSSLKQAAKKGIISGNPAASVEKPKPVQFNASFYNADEMLDVLEAVKGTNLELAVMLGFYGLRRSEVVGLRWEAVDFENNSISIKFTVTQYSHDGKRQIEAKPRTKNKSSRRTLPMIPALKAKLLAMQEEREEWRRLCGRSYNNEYLDFVYVDEMGERIKPDYITQAFDRVLKKHGLRKVRFHDLRHSCASLLLANGVSMKEIQDWLGHSTFKTTADSYTHLAFDSKLASANALNIGTAFGKIAQLQPQKASVATG